MRLPWIGRRKIAVIPAMVNDPLYKPAPSDWVQQIQSRLFYSPDPTSGNDASLRAYIYAISYGQAILDADVFAPVTLTAPPYRVDDAMRAVPAVSTYDYCCVIFTANNDGATGYAWWDYNWPGDPPYPPPNFCRVNMAEGLGVWAMEVLHMTTTFGDLYNVQPPNLQPGGFDEMACSCGTHPSAYTKLSMGWLSSNSIATVAGTAQRTFDLHALALLQPPPPGRVTAVRVPSPNSAVRYFLIEARLAVDIYERATPGISGGIPSQGVVVYEVDPAIGPLVLRTPIALQPGQTYANPAEQFQVTVLSSIPGGFTIQVDASENTVCVDLRNQMTAIKEDIQSLQEQMVGATPQQKAEIARMIRAAQANLKALQDQAQQLGCLITSNILAHGRPPHRPHH